MNIINIMNIDINIIDIHHERQHHQHEYHIDMHHEHQCNNHGTYSTTTTQHGERFLFLAASRKIQWTSVTGEKTVKTQESRWFLSKESTFLLALCFADLMNDQADATLGNDVRDAIAKLDEPHQCLLTPWPSWPSWA
jgi:hypothetical protein